MIKEASKQVFSRQSAAPVGRVLKAAILTVFAAAALCGCLPKQQNTASSFVDPSYVPSAYVQAEDQAKRKAQQQAQERQKQPVGLGTDSAGNHFFSIPGLLYLGQKPGGNLINPSDHFHVGVGTYPVKSKNFPGSGIKTRVDTNWQEPNGYDENGNPRFKSGSSHYDSNPYNND